jgi:peptidyl-tRNA hydrolase, PTH1 family
VKWIVGLGNPGKAYERTRHNIGFLVADELANRLKVRWRRSWRVPALIAKGMIGSEPVRLMKPQTFMNRSGQAVGPLLRRTKSGPEDLLLIVDDTSLAWGQLRIRPKGSAGGHNGVQSVIDAAGSGAFGRIRVGIGEKPAKVSLSDHVLGPFSDGEERQLGEVIRRAADAVETIFTAGAEPAMNRFNRGLE